MKRWCFLFVLLSAVAIAQDKPNFSGKWQLDTAKSEFGEMPAPNSQLNVIEHKDPEIKLTQTIKSESVPGGEASMERHFTTDGKENVNSIGQADVKSTCKWDANKLLIASKIQAPVGEIAINDSWELADGGKQMVIARQFKLPDGERRQRLIFSKQP